MNGPLSTPNRFFIYKTRKQVAEQVLGPVNWISATEGFLPCPGLEKHTTLDGVQDCKVWLDGVPTLYCFHSSCADEIEEMNSELRRTMNSELVDDTEEAPGPPRMFVRTKPKPELALEAKQCLPAILRKFAWPLDELRASSPATIPSDPAEHFREYLKLYPSDDIIWIGEIYDSGKEVHRSNFRRVAEWVEHARAHGPMVCPACFQPGVMSRCNMNVLERRFLVVESDTIDDETARKLAADEPLTAADKLNNKLGCAAIFRWLREHVGLRLRAVVDSGNKSLHGHFDLPSPECLAELEIILPALKCDTALMRPSQPVRLPGWNRDGEFQRLLFLDLKKEGEPSDAAS